ncbi:FliM/FliN family flagellar motor C-terminal domain-containing protein [Litorisediminicola beolgyonensis]|uniref:FliM/FliN family flagellar motor C-terminal domain-containing protein n=1 Tax=Litorisediminicola beolgyonensis TaxID=1173614 RepID=A0ABW3ZJ43_9RHOB
MPDRRASDDRDGLRQKAQAARRRQDARGMSLEKAFCRAFARAAEGLWDLAVLAREPKSILYDQEMAVRALSNCDLILLLDGPDGQPGFAGFDRTLVAGLIEIQTLGLVSAMRPEERVFTATDAAMTAPLLDDALTRFAGYAAALDEEPAAEFRFGAMLESARSAGNLLNASAYRGFTAALDLAGGRRHGRVVLLLPVPEHDDAADEPAGTSRGRPHEALMLGLPAQLDVVLARVTLPLSQVRDFQPGDVLSLPRGALGTAELVAGPRHRISRGRLGQVDGHRAFRLSDALGGQPQAAEPAPDTPTAVADAPARAAPPPAPRALPETLPDLPPLTFDEIGPGK